MTQNSLLESLFWALINQALRRFKCLNFCCNHYCCPPPVLGHQPILVIMVIAVWRYVAYLDVGTGSSHNDDTLTELADYFGGAMMLYTITLPLSIITVSFILAFIIVTGGDGLLFRICREDKSRKEELNQGFCKPKKWLTVIKWLTM